MTPGLLVELEYVGHLASKADPRVDPLTLGVIAASCVWYVVGPILVFLSWFDAPLREMPVLVAVRTVHLIYWFLSSWMTVLIVAHLD